MRTVFKAAAAIFVVGVGIFTALVGADYATDAVEELVSGGDDGKDRKAA